MQLRINSIIIPLDAGISLPLVLSSPLFITDNGKIPGSYIFNFSIPAGNQIRQAFGQAHRAQRGSRATAELPYLITSGSLRFSGNCVVTEASLDSYEISCKIGNGDLVGKLVGKTLKDLDLGGDQIITDFGCSAFNALDVVNSTELTLLHPLGFPNVYIDIADNFSYLGGSAYFFVANINASVKMKLSFFLSDTDMENYQVRLYKNTLIHEVFSLVFDSNEIETTQDVVNGDSFYWAIYAEKKNEGNLRYTLTDIFVNYHGSNIFNDVVLTNQETSDFAIFPIHNESFLENFPDDAFQLDNLSIKTIYSNLFPVLNYYINNEFPLFLSGFSEGEFVHCANLFTPFVYMRTILRKIASEAGYTIVNNPFDTDAFGGMVLFNAYAENTYTSDTTWFLPVKQTFNLLDHVPAIAQADFIKWVSILTGFMPMVDNELMQITFVDLKNKHVVTLTNTTIPFPGTLLANPLVKVSPEYAGIKFELVKASSDNYLSTIKEISEKLVYKGAVDSLIDLPSTGNQVNDMYLVTELNEYYVYQYNPQTYTLTWFFHSKKFPLIYTEGVQPFLQVTTELSPILTSRILDESLDAPEGRLWTLPKTQQAGILEGFPDSLGNEYGKQVLYYKGMVKDSLEQDYPLGSSRCADFSKIVNYYPDISAISLFENQYHGFLRWLAYDAKPVTYKAVLSRGQLKRIKFDQIYSGTGFNFLVKEIRVNMMMDDLSMCEVDIYTV